MAAALSFSPRTLPYTNQTQTLTLALPRIIHFPYRLSRSRLVKGSLKASDSHSNLINRDEGNRVCENASSDVEDQTDVPTMRTLIQAYKKAILDGDEECACEVEAAICSIDYEKNDLSQKYTEAIAEISSAKSTFLRLKADMENFRKRTEKDRITFSSDVRGEVFESLLPMIDSFEKAKQHTKTETEKERNIDTSYQGIYKQFVEIMRSSRVAVVETVGKPFDPSIHEAIGREESRQFNEGIVVQEVQRGFFLGGRLLRAATVKVSSGPGPKKYHPLTKGSHVRREAAVESVEG